MTQLVRKRVSVGGRVQGVGFRWFAQAAALEAGVAGWVRNMPDGSVLCEAEGTVAAFDAFVAALHGGPRCSVVRSVEVEDIPLAATAPGFEILH